MVMGVMLLFSLPLMAQTGKEWDDVTVTQVNREVAHTLSIPYGSESDIENNLMEASPYFLSLNGVWKFKWVPDPSQKPIDFYVPSYDVSGWDDIEVPSVWQMENYSESRSVGFGSLQVFYHNPDSFDNGSFQSGLGISCYGRCDYA